MCIVGLFCFVCFALFLVVFLFVFVLVGFLLLFCSTWPGSFDLLSERNTHTERKCQKSKKKETPGHKKDAYRKMIEIGLISS